MSTSTWIMLLAILTAFMFRLLPIATSKLRFMRDTQAPLYRFLNYSSQAMLGVLCFELVFGKNSITHIVTQFGLLHALSFILLLIAFLATCKSGKVAFPFLICSLIYVSAATVVSERLLW